mmetsp:Transcript_19/g.50  ORF Transcript_19/g.50 Transcript_19/m.50 type:complete len:216 (-) Transcript_19:121-768(-)
MPLKRVGSRDSLGRMDPEAELEFVNKHDHHEGTVWYLVEAQWLKRWKAYVTKKGAVPGPISNAKLLDARTGFRVPVPGLKLKEHYRGVGVEVWQFLLARHGGGPEIMTEALDIYKATVKPMEQPADAESGSPKPSLPGSPKAMHTEQSASSSRSTGTGGTEGKAAPSQKGSTPKAKKGLLKSLLGSFSQRRPSDEKVSPKERPQPQPRFSQLSDT